MKALFNGKFIENDEHIISADNRGLRFGDGVFETMRSVDGKPILLERHLERLLKGIELLKIKLPLRDLREDLERQIISVLSKNKVQFGRIRVTVFRGNGGLSENWDEPANTLIQCWDLKQKPTFNSNGLDLKLYDASRKATDAFSNIKHNNFLPYVMGMIEAKEQKANDAIILNTNGRICETCLANIWIYKDGKFTTPPLSEGPIAGVMRGFLIEYLRDKVEEKQLTIVDLKTADEVFLTNSVRVMNWVKQFEDKTYTNVCSINLFAELQRLFPAYF